MGLQRFVPEPEPREVSLAVVNRESPRPVQRLLKGMFDEQPVDVTDIDTETGERDMVYLLEDGTVTEKSPLGAVKESILLVNSDLYITGTRTAREVDLPAVIEGLQRVPFRLRGYPESNKEKLLLITVSRYIERLALEHEGGVHRASFQELSRINDERGTREVYEKLAASGTDTHVYGMPDWTPSPDFDVTIHGGWHGDFRDSWFVVHVPEDDSRRHAALVAIETEPGTWNAFWTYDAETVERINRHIEREL